MRDPTPMRRPAEVDRGTQFKREECLIRFGGIYMGSSGSQLSHVPVSSPMYTSENHFRTAASFEFVFLRCRGQSVFVDTCTV